MLLTFYKKAWLTFAIFTALTCLLAASRRLDHWMFIRRLRKSPFYLDEVEIVLSLEGFISTETKSRVEFKWGVFTDAVRFPDGFLLLVGQHQFYWLPHSALASGSASEVEALLRHALPSFREL